MVLKKCSKCGAALRPPRKPPNTKGRHPISARILERLAEKEMTVSDLALASGMRVPTLHYYLHRSIPRTELLEALADALGVSVQWLVTGQEAVAP